MSSENVESTMCNGKWLMKNREILVLNESDLIEQVKIKSEEIKTKAKIVLPNRFPVVDII